MKKLNFIMILFVMLFLTSCEIPTSVKFDNYVDRVEENCEKWTEEDWEMSKEKYRQLLKEYEANYDNMTQEERDAINKAIGRYNGILMKKGLEKVDESIKGFIDKYFNILAILFVEGQRGCPYFDQRLLLLNVVASNPLRLASPEQDTL